MMQMLANDFDPLLNERGRQVVTCLHKMFDLVKYPGITNGSPSNHDSTNAETILIFQRFFGGINIAITENRDINSRVVFNLCNQRPVSLAFIKLCSCSPMNSQD